MDLHEQASVLIVGAGPTGLAAALFLAHRGVRARIIDKSAGPSRTSRAQVINPRSLELLEATGVSQAILAEARSIRGVKFYENWSPIAELDFSGLPSRYQMSVIPQSRTEALLIGALSKFQIAPDRRVGFTTLAQNQQLVHATLRDADGRLERVDVPLLLGADGAHSTVREVLGISFEGREFPEPWPLYDLHLDDPLDLDHAHVSFVEGGLVFLLCIRPGVWRLFGNVEGVLTRLPAGAQPGAIEWQSLFHIADKLVAAATEGRVALAGDAAPIHSPVGARGMNLGIEDAFVYADCAARALCDGSRAITEYGRLRHPVHAAVVARMDKLTSLARGQPGWIGLLRHYLFPAVTRFGPAARFLRDFIAGVDQPTRLHV